MEESYENELNRLWVSIWAMVWELIGPTKFWPAVIANNPVPQAGIVTVNK